MEKEEFELTEAERAALAALPRELAPSDLLEERVVRELRTSGYIASPSGHQWKRQALRIAAAIILFVGGAATGRYLLAPDAAQQAVADTIEQQDSSAGSVSPSSRPVESRIQSTPARNGERTVAQREMWL